MRVIDAIMYLHQEDELTDEDLEFIINIAQDKSKYLNKHIISQMDTILNFELYPSISGLGESVAIRCFGTVTVYLSNMLDDFFLNKVFNTPFSNKLREKFFIAVKHHRKHLHNMVKDESN